MRLSALRGSPPPVDPDPSEVSRFVFLFTEGGSVDIDEALARVHSWLIQS